MQEAGWLLLLLFLGVCALIVVALMWPSFRRTQRTPTNTTVEATLQTLRILDEAHQQAETQASAPAQAHILSIQEWLAIVNERPDEAPHTLIIGTSGTGKTTIAQALAATRTGYLAILDPKWQPGKWGGLPAIAIDDDGHYTQLETAIQALLQELTTRLVSLKQGVTAFDELTIIAEELPILSSECPSAPNLFKQVGWMGRELRLRLIGLSQSERVKSLGLAGEGDAKDNYTLIRLGKAALDCVPEARTLPRPAALTWKGEQYLLILDGLLHFSNHSIPESRMYAFEAAKSTLKKHKLIDSSKQGESAINGDSNAELPFSVEEIGSIVSLILQNTEKTTAIRAMPRYNRNKHKEYTAYYERFRTAIDTSTRHTAGQCEQ